MRSIAVLIDLSGTLFIDDYIIPRSIEALLRLSANPIYRVKFVTNTTKESSSHLYEKLKKFGFDVSHSQIFSSLSAARQLIIKNSLRPMLILEEDARNDFSDIDTNNPNSVVIGLAPSLFNFKTLNKAFNLVLDGAELIAIHKGRYYRRKDGLSLGPGPFVEALEYATGVKATVVGKPESVFFRSAIESFGEEITQAVMIGDDVRDDVLGAVNAGMLGILVKTGKYRQGKFFHRDELLIEESSRNCVDCFADAVELVEKGNIW
ncbi:unnamed protein product [Dracunculus medinensis]|uniref:Haloacid dehalogenase-like hydrolase domain-containing protein 2 n=1 Tax=Dracunculus medinensis TaxID=318479 RepID=A0A0N4UE39_DRAME|nr:unnamed protein product [Dracunculus medinensis]